MRTCYVDESGNEQALTTPDASPVLALAGISVPHTNINDLTWSFLQLKNTFNPHLRAGSLSDLIKAEVKGAGLRKASRSTSRRERRRAVGFIDKTLALLERFDCTVVGYVRTKRDGEQLRPGVYPEAIGLIADSFEAQLAETGEMGIMILDARTKVKNVPSVHRATTQRFRKGGSAYPHMVESPVFGHSDAHVPLQIADIVVSALLFPIACAAYCHDVRDNVHADSAYLNLRSMFGERLRALEHRYVDEGGDRRGGVRVIDVRGRRPTLLLYRESADARAEQLVIEAF